MLWCSLHWTRMTETGKRKEINFWCDPKSKLRLISKQWGEEKVIYYTCGLIKGNSEDYLLNHYKYFFTLTLNILFASWLTINFLKCAIPSSSSLYKAKYTNTEKEREMDSWIHAVFFPPHQLIRRSSPVNKIQGDGVSDYKCTKTHQYKHFCQHEGRSCQLQHNMHPQQPNETTWESNI